MLKILYLNFFFMVIPFFLNGQVTIYQSYEDFKSDKGEKYGHYKSHIAVMGSVKLNFAKVKKKGMVNCKDIWGFKYDDMLFRVHKKFKQPARVMHEGEIIYYENGLAHLEMIKRKSEMMNITTGYAVYFSKDLSSELIPMPSTGQAGGKPYKQFKKANPKLRSLFNCIDQAPVFYSIRECMKQ